MKFQDINRIARYKLKIVRYKLAILAEKVRIVRYKYKYKCEKKSIFILAELWIQRKKVRIVRYKLGIAKYKLASLSVCKWSLKEKKCTKFSELQEKSQNSVFVSHNSFLLRIMRNKVWIVRQVPITLFIYLFIYVIQWWGKKSE